MYQRKPDWLKIKITQGASNRRVERLLDGLKLHTICCEGNCPNRLECFHCGTATFLILGDRCTRGCTFCNVHKGMPGPIDPEEPERVAEAARRLALKHVVVTSVTRDDLPDGGAAQFAQTVRAIREKCPRATVEILIPDFRLNDEALRAVTAACPDVLNHNVETVPTLYPGVRPGADYRRSLRLLERVKELDGGIVTKSGMMLGLGETLPEVKQVMRDLRDVGCDMLTIGQYLAPSAQHHPVAAYIPPKVFEELRLLGRQMGFGGIASAPLARSSYHAGEFLGA